jgi:hypothetical protein
MKWNERLVMMRAETLFYANTADDVLRLAASCSPSPSDKHITGFKGCKAEECPADAKGPHWAFTLSAHEVMLANNCRAPSQLNGLSGGPSFVCQ